jgi:hypothetical protein
MDRVVLQDKKEIMGLLTAKGDTAEDKLRLFLIFYLTAAIPEEDLPVPSPLSLSGPFPHPTVTSEFAHAPLLWHAEIRSRPHGSWCGPQTVPLPQEVRVPPLTHRTLFQNDQLLIIFITLLRG